MTFKTIHIENFKSVKDVTYEYMPGVWEVLGDNQDSTFRSNGSGKTTVLEAVQQCLFNRTTFSIPIEDVSRKAVNGETTKLYKITVTFEANGHEYAVINDRKRMKITILEDGVDLGVTSIRNALLKIQHIINMDFSTFTTLTFITLTTIVDLLDNFSSSSLMKVVLDFNEITEMDKQLKLGLKKIVEDTITLQQQVKQIEDTIEILTKYDTIDTSPMHRTIAKCTRGINEVTIQKNDLTDTLNENLTILSNIDRAKKQIDSLNEGVCSCCGTPLTTDIEKLQELQETLQASLTLGVTNASCETLNVEIARLNDELLALTETLKDAKARLLVADTKNQMYQEYITKSDNLRTELITVKEEQKTLLEREDIVKTAISLIKSGTLHKTLLNTFTSLLNNYLSQLKSFVNLPYISIETVAHRSNVEFILTDTRFGQTIHLNSLSGGEKTRLRLIILLAMLNTIKDLTGAATNILVLDEALDTLDVSASKDLARLFNYMITHDDKFIALVSHGEQLKDIEFSGTFHVTKLNGITTLEVSQ